MHETGADTARGWPLVGRADALDVLRALRHRPRQTSAVVWGPAGVGKSRLAIAALEEATTEGWATVSVRASSGLAGVPLGVLRTALDIEPSAEMFELTASVERGLLSLRSSAGVLLLVDDGQHLDDASAALLHQLVAAGSIVLLATVRSGAQPPTALTALWKDGLAERIELADLDHGQVTELLTASLGGPVAESTVDRLWQVTGGNPLYLREVVLASSETGALHLTAGEWRWDGEWASGAHLQEVVAARLGRLDPDELTAMEVIAVTGGPVPLGLVTSLATAVAVESLEERSLVTVESSGRRLEVSIAHPVHAEVIRAGLAPLRERAMRRNLVDAVLATGARRGSDRVRIACWSIESGLEVDPVTLSLGVDATLFQLGYAFAARLDEILGGVPLRLPLRAAPRLSADPGLAVRLAGAAYEASGGIAAGVSYATTLTWLGETERAEAVLVELAGSVKAPNEKLRLALSLGWFRFWGRYDADGAREVLVDAAAAAAGAGPDAGYDSHLLAEVYQQLAGIELNTGWPARALALAERAAEVLGTDLTPPVLSPVAAASIGYLARCAEAIDLTDRAVQVAISAGSHALAVPGLLFARAGALSRSGRLEEARQVAEMCRQVALSNDSLDGVASFGVLVGEILLRQGQPASAARMFRDASGLLSERDIFGYRPWALAGLARARASTGDEPGAAAALEEAQAIRMIPRHYQMSLFHAEIQLLALRGESEEAAGKAAEAAAWARSAGMLVEEVLVLDLKHRLKPTAETLERLRELSALTDSGLAATVVQHAEGLLSADPEMLLAAGEQFASMGSWWMAAEASFAAAEALYERGETRPAQAASRLAAGYAEHCEGAISAFSGAASPPTVLTRRETEIARSFASGRSSKEIADQLYLSRRTVEGHIYRVYTKLGVSDRAALGAAIGGRQHNA